MGIISVGLILEGTIEIVRNNNTGIQDYIVQWVSNSMLLISCDSNSFCSNFFKGNKDEMAILKSSRRFHDKN